MSKYHCCPIAPVQLCPGPAQTCREKLNFAALGFHHASKHGEGRAISNDILIWNRRKERLIHAESRAAISKMVLGTGIMAQ